MELQDDEIILLDDCSLGLREKMVLTNKRIIVQKGKGIFCVTWKNENEIPLGEIEECYSDVNFVDGCALRIRLKNNKEVSFVFQGKIDSMLTDGFNTYTQMQKGKSDRWIIAINQAREKIEQKPEKPLEVLQLRFAKGEISKAEYEGMKQVLEEN